MQAELVENASVLPNASLEVENTAQKNPNKVFGTPQKMLSYFIPLFIAYLVTLHDAVQSQTLKNIEVTVKTEDDKTTTKISCEKENGTKHDVGIVHERLSTPMYAFCIATSVCYQLNTRAIRNTQAIMARFHAGTTEMKLGQLRAAGTVILNAPRNVNANHIVIKGSFKTK